MPHPFHLDWTLVAPLLVVIGEGRVQKAPEYEELEVTPVEEFFGDEASATALLLAARTAPLKWAEALRSIAQRIAGRNAHSRVDGSRYESKLDSVCRRLRRETSAELILGGHPKAASDGHLESGQL